MHVAYENNECLLHCFDRLVSQEYAAKDQKPAEFNSLYTDFLDCFS